MSPAQTTAREISALRADLTAMGQDMKKLMSDSASGFGHASSAAASRMDGVNGADHGGYGSLGTRVGEGVKAATGILEKRPILALSVAAGLGWLAGRLLMR